MTSEQIQARLSKAEFTLSDIDKKAEELGLTRTDFILTAVDMLLNFDKAFYTYLKQYSEFLKVPVWQVIQNVIARRFAWEAAEDEAYGKRTRSFEEFYQYRNDQGKPVSPGYEELFKNLTGKYVDELKREKK